MKMNHNMNIGINMNEEPGLKNTPIYTGQKTVVVGFGRSGLAMAEFLLDRGAAVTVTDSAHTPEMLEASRTIRERGALIEFGQHRIDTFTSADLVVMSPGVPSSIPPVVEARKSGVPITGELELASRFITEPITAVTGTNGKTTVVTLLGEILAASGKKVFVGGNIGRPLIGHVSSGNKVDLVVIEVSSFQLETAEYLQPHIAVLLNVSPDHLDRYPDYEAYFQAKARLFARQDADDCAVINEDDALASGLKTISGRLGFSRVKKIGNGAFTTSSQITFHREGRVVGEIPIRDIKLTGKHNQENIMAAGLAALASGVPFETVLNTVVRFQGLPHRVQLVAEIEGVRYFDDSKGTNVGALVKSLESFNEPIILIAGGRDKDSDFSVLKHLVRQKVKLLLLIGEAAEKMETALRGATETMIVESMEPAVERARIRSRAGDVVLLSPACASFDMYKDYAERGNHFAQLVRKAMN